jgi:hypothetical protein
MRSESKKLLSRVVKDYYAGIPGHDGMLDKRDSCAIIYNLAHGEYEHSFKMFEDIVKYLTSPGITEEGMRRTMLAYSSDDGQVEIAKPPEPTKKAVPKVQPRKVLLSQKRAARKERIYARSSGICYICGESVSYEEMTVDHVIPKAWGGSNAESNLRATHYECNQKKGHRTPNHEQMARIKSESDQKHDTTQT